MIMGKCPYAYQTCELQRCNQLPDPFETAKKMSPRKWKKFLKGLETCPNQGRKVTLNEYKSLSTRSGA